MSFHEEKHSFPFLCGRDLDSKSTNSVHSPTDTLLHVISGILSHETALNVRHIIQLHL